jgi:hypothetical protein
VSDKDAYEYLLRQTQALREALEIARHAMDALESYCRQLPCKKRYPSADAQSAAEEQWYMYEQFRKQVDGALAALKPESAEVAPPALDGYCPKCHKLILVPNTNYGIHPDAICMCQRAAPQQQRGH